MPYVTPNRRELLSPLIRELSSSITSSGDLNYAITMLLVGEYPESYDDYNTLLGVLECVKQEFYRRAVSEYENIKIEENGDVYPQSGGEREAEGD